jgi:hypothetical protein
MILISLLTTFTMQTTDITSAREEFKTAIVAALNAAATFTPNAKNPTAIDIDVESFRSAATPAARSAEDWGTFASFVHANGQSKTKQQALRCTTVAMQHPIIAGGGTERQSCVLNEGEVVVQGALKSRSASATTVMITITFPHRGATGSADYEVVMQQGKVVSITQTRQS